MPDEVTTDGPAPPTRPPVGAWIDGPSTDFAVWAPSAGEVTLLVGDDAEPHPLEAHPSDEGMWTVQVPEAAPGTRYRYQLDGGPARPDPASASQPDGVHGASAVVDLDFAWTDDGFVGPALEDSVFYELHVGTFTASGTFDAVIEHLAGLAELGVTTVELMPIAEFPGGRNWGYDGVFPFAAQSTYGGLDGLRRLVDAAHGAGLAVCLDVVHNHLGPEGNVLGEYGPYFTDRYRTPWGDALNFDGTGSDHVRGYFLESADFFAAHAHVDAFRLDAVHAIVDNTAYPYVEQLTAELHARGAARGRPVLVVAESAADDPRLVRPVDAGGWGLDGQWNDDFHHALHVALTGEHDGYYADYDGIDDLAVAIREGFTHHGGFAPARGHSLGHPVLRPEPGQMVVCSANHDQVGNRLLGDRLTTQVDAERAKLAAALVILSPSVPLLFMGDEDGETAPFPYFVSHTDPELVEAVRRGRAEEFAAFASGGTPPDPQSEETYRSAVLDHHRAQQGPGARRRQLHQALLEARRLHRPQSVGDGVIAAPGDGSLVISWDGRPELDDLVLLASFRDGDVVLALPEHPPDGERHPWTVVVDTAAASWDGPGEASPDAATGAWSLHGPSAVLLRRERAESPPPQPAVRW